MTTAESNVESIAAMSIREYDVNELFGAAPPGKGSYYQCIPHADIPHINANKVSTHVEAPLVALGVPAAVAGIIRSYTEDVEDIALAAIR
jgi:hypothetical protein